MASLDSSRSRILIVDGKQGDVLSLVSCLEQEFEVFCVTTGEQALAFASSKKKPDLILLNTMLPDIDGFEVCERLKAAASTYDIPVIFLTREAEEELKAKGVMAGAQDYIIKPVDAEEVRARILNSLNLKKELDRRLILRNRMEELDSTFEQQIREREKDQIVLRQTFESYERNYVQLLRSRDGSTRKNRVLIVDDSPENVHLIVRSLEPVYEILCASTGKEAMNIAFSAKPPDLILLDIMMPGMDGYEVCSRLKAHGPTADIPIIFVSALGQEVDETTGLRHGAVDYITKPFNPTILKERISSALRTKEDIDQHIAFTRKLEELNKDLENKIKFKNFALKEATSNLKASEDKYREIYENAPEGIYQSTFDGRFLTANSALIDILGYDSASDLIEQMGDIRNQLYVNPGERDELRRILEKQDSVVGFEAQFYRKNRDKVWCSLSTRVVRDEAGKPLYFEGFITDITERKKLEEKLRHAAKMEAMGRLISGISHDFNNMMTPVIGFSELLLNTSKLMEKERDFLKVIKKSGVSAAALTRRLLTFSRRHIIQPRNVDLNHVINDMRMILKPMLGEGISIDYDLDANLRSVFADPGEIEQVIMNLAVNARDAMPEGGQLMIKTVNMNLDHDLPEESVVIPAGEYVVLRVEDTGFGMNETILGHIFEPFFTTKALGEGTGIGLATIYGIAKQYRGYVTVFSRPGEGATFKVYLPATEEMAEPVFQKTDVDLNCRGSETILVVEDDSNICLLAEAILKQQGYSVFIANSVKACLSFMKDYRGHLDLLIADVVVSHSNDKRLVSEITLMYPDIKFLYMSGYTKDLIFKHGILEDGTEFLQKPFSVSTLVATVRTVLDGL